MVATIVTVKALVDWEVTPAKAVEPSADTTGVVTYGLPKVIVQAVESVPVVIVPTSSLEFAESVPPEGVHETVGVAGVLEAIKCPY